MTAVQKASYVSNTVLRQSTLHGLCTMDWLNQTSAPGNNKGCILQTMTSCHAHFLSSTFTKNHNYLLYRQLWHNREVTISHPYSLAISACTKRNEDVLMLLGLPSVAYGQLLLPSVKRQC